MLQNKRCIIVGGGASIRQNLWDTSIPLLPIWNALRNEITFALNYSYKYINSTVALYRDYQYYSIEKEKLDKLPLVITLKDGAYIRKDVELGNNVILLKGANEYYGEDSWKFGFFSGQLVGIFTLNVAIRLGFKKIFLLGYDANETNGRTHFYEDDGVIGHYTYNGNEHCGIGKDKNDQFKTGNYNRPKELNNKYFNSFKVDLERGVRIYNVSPESAINTFEKINYSQFYKMLQDGPQIIDQDDIREKIKGIIDEKTKN